MLELLKGMVHEWEGECRNVSSKAEKTQAALAVLGKQMTVEVRDAA